MSRNLTAEAIPPAGTELATSRRWPVVVGLGLIALGAFSFYLYSLRMVDLADLSDIGLISVMPPQALAAVGVLNLTFFLALAQREARISLLGAHAVLLIFMLYGVTALVEPAPRFSTAWVHAGFVHFIADTGQTMPSVDARYSWPGFFSLVALLTRVTGAENLTEVVRWAPTGLNLLCLIPLLMIARQMTDSWREQWLAIWLFYLTNWVGQDYFSPQGTGFFVFLVFMAILLIWFSSRRSMVLASAEDPARSSWWAAPVRRVASLARRLGSSLRLPGPLAPGGRATKPATSAERVGLVLLLLALFAYITTSHQLTPFMLISAVSLLVVAGYCSLRGLPLLMGAMVLLWISYMTVSYWSGWLGDVIGDAGQLGSNVSTSVADRIKGSQGHIDVLQIRLAFTLGVWALAAIGLLRRLWRGYGDWRVVLLAAAPFPIMALQDYGGEALLRVYLFSLPFVAILGARAFLPSPAQRPGWVVVGAAACVSLVLVGGFFVARYGNERFEYLAPGELAAAEYLNANLPREATLVSLMSSLPIAPRTSLEFRPMDEEVPIPDARSLGDIAAIKETMASGEGGNGFFYISRGQVAYTEIVYGLPRGWAVGLEKRLISSGGVRRVYSNPDARIYRLAGE
jgi:hypothetical protein